MLVVAGIFAAIAGCSSDERPTYNGHTVDNAAEVLVVAEKLFVREMDEVVQDGLAAYSDQSRCYFVRARTGDDRAVSGSLRCGPVRVLGEQPDHNWYAVGVRSRTFTDNTTSLGLANDRLGSLLKLERPSSLVRPDGQPPAPANSVRAPQADPFPVSDFALLIDRDTLELDAQWRWNANRYEVKTPAMSMTFDASGALKVLPGEVMKALVVPGEPVADVQWYLPPNERHIRAWQVTIRATDTSDTTLLVDSGLSERAVANLPCQEQPCADLHVGRYYLVASGLATERPELIVLSGDREQVIDLATGREVSR